MSGKLDMQFFSNGRVAFYKHDDFEEAINNDKELLIVCNAWSGGYAVAIGAEKGYDPDFGPCRYMYTLDVKDMSFTSEEMTKRFHKVIFTSGEQIRMMTREQATYFGGHLFIDWGSSVDDILGRTFKDNPTSDEEIMNLRKTVDPFATINFLPDDEDKKEKVRNLVAYRVITPEQLKEYNKKFPKNKINL